MVAAATVAQQAPAQEAELALALAQGGQQVAVGESRLQRAEEQAWAQRPSAAPGLEQLQVAQAE